ncbi:MAG: gliding motility-associated C-terminal domain-containing protein, partial [Firmicutes bacterium]|nr:gliding motility-associated C-terminal domain-containing protein [Bacillota bacterium]
VHDIEKAGATNAAGTEPASITIDPVSGDIIWDAPAIQGQYNIAFIIEEWRKVDGTWYKLGYVTRDMQILIEESENNPPKLYLPLDTCVEAGTTLDVEIFAEDPDGHDITIETFSGIFGLFGPAVTVDPGSAIAQPNPARLHFTWQTHCNHVREKPYQIIFKATDHPSEKNKQPPLVDFGSWFVTVVAPAPSGLAAFSSPDNNVVLQWDPYTCRYAEKMQIWRRVGSYEYEYGHCETGIPKSGGYELIDEISITDTTYIDTGQEAGLAYGAKYCYRLVAEFPRPRGGKSYPSKEVCVITETGPGPVITHVDVEKTGDGNGEIIVSWIPPAELNEEIYEPPYSYKLYRSDSVSTEIFINEISVLNYEDTTYLDTELNTLSKTYYYKVKLYDNRDSLIAASPFASSVRLYCSPVKNGVELSWKADVPWSINTQNYPWHYIFRDHFESADSDKLVLIDSVNVNTTGFRYIDTGQADLHPLDEKKKYHYFVKTFGSYSNPDIPEPQINRSQILGTYPNDTIAPCAPFHLHFGNITSIHDCKEFIKDKPCNFREFYNELFWEKDLTGNCDLDNSSFNIYFSDVSAGGPYEMIANVSDTFFIHKHLNSFAGCYRVSALDNSGNESELSDPICHDNCPYY